LFSSATKLLLALTVAAIVGAIAVSASVDDKTAAVLFGFVAFASLSAAIAVMAGGITNIAPAVPADAPAPQRRATTPGAPARPSGWPLAAAAAVVLLAVGAATGVVTVYAGLIAVILTGFGWFAASWADHSTWTRRVRSRLIDRLLAPVGMPLGGFLLAAVVAISVSRILLAVPKDVSVIIALAVAVVLLLAFYWVASRPRMASSVLVALASLAGVSVVGAGIAGATQGEREFHPHEPGPLVLNVVARNVQFEEKALTAPAHKKITIRFVNDDKAIFHNVAIYKGEGIEAVPEFNGEGFPGIKTMKYELETPDPGTYRFQCDFHANMTGTFTVGT
jgi:plastocyanin